MLDGYSYKNTFRILFHRKLRGERDEKKCWKIYESSFIFPWYHFVLNIYTLHYLWDFFKQKFTRGMKWIEFRARRWCLYFCSIFNEHIVQIGLIGRNLNHLYQKNLTFILIQSPMSPCWRKNLENTCENPGGYFKATLLSLPLRWCLLLSISVSEWVLVPK